jgi:hypothetical protein
VALKAIYWSTFIEKVDFGLLHLDLVLFNNNLIRISQFYGFSLVLTRAKQSTEDLERFQRVTFSEAGTILNFLLSKIFWEQIFIHRK